MNFSFGSVSANIPAYCSRSSARDYDSRPLADGLTPLLITEAMFAIIFYFVHWFMQYARRMGLKGQQQELQALRALRENLVSDEKNDQES